MKVRITKITILVIMYLTRANSFNRSQQKTKNKRKKKNNKDEKQKNPNKHLQEKVIKSQKKNTEK